MNTNGTPKYADIGARIKEARRRCYLTLDGLGQKVGTSRQHLIRLERGEHMARPQLLDAIARETGTTVRDLIGEKATSDDEEVAQLLLRVVEKVVERKVEQRLVDLGLRDEVAA